MPQHKTRRQFLAAAGLAATTAAAGCSSSGSSDDGDDGVDDQTTAATTTEESMTGMSVVEDAPRASIDRFSDDAGTLHVRSENDALPGPDEPIDFDQAMFHHHGFGPDGGVVSYYDFDVQPTNPAPIYALVRESEDSPVEGQLNVVGTIPGDDDYNDFWQVHHVTVPDDYEANEVTSVEGIGDAGYDVEATDTVKNCPIVPDDSTAEHRAGDGSAELVEAWYEGNVVYYFRFEEASLSLSDGSVPLSPIYVTFNANPEEDGGGPQSGFMTEADGDQNHNVVASLPGDDAYSPLWTVNIYDNADFNDVSDVESARNAELLAGGAANVNCPVVSVGEQAE